MDIGTVSMLMSQSMTQTASSMSVMKLAMNTGVGNATKMADIMKI